MKNILILKMFALLCVSVLLLVHPIFINFSNAQSAEIQSATILLNPTEINFLGRDNGGRLSSELGVVLEEIPPTADILSLNLTYTQKGVSSGILRILDKRSLSILDSISLGREGERVTSRIDSIVQDWIKNPSNNFGLIFQTSELENDANVKLETLSITIEYTVPDKTSPQILEFSGQILRPGVIRVFWEADEPVKGIVSYGKTSLYDRSSDSTDEFAELGEIILEDLSPNLTYHVQLTLTDQSGNLTKSDNLVIEANSGIRVEISENQQNLIAPRLFNVELQEEGGKHTVELAWSKSESVGFTGYIIYRNLKDGAFSEIARLSSEVTRYSDPKVEPGNTYSYYVVAYSGLSQSSRSPVQTIEIPQSGVLGVGSILSEGNRLMLSVLVGSALVFMAAITYLVRKKIQNSINYNKSFKRKARLHNVLHDPNYYASSYEDSVIDKIQN